MPSRVKSSTRHVPRRSSNSSRIGPSSDRESVMASPASGWNENVTDARTSTSRRSARSRHARHLERRRGSDPVGVDRAGDRSRELAVLDAQPVHPPLQPFAATSAASVRRVGVRIARVRAHERRRDRACTRRLRRVVGCHLVRGGRAGRSRRRRAARDRGDRDEQQRGDPSEAHRGAESTPAFGRGWRSGSGGMLASGGAGRAAAVDLRIGRGKSGLRRAGCWGDPGGGDLAEAQQRKTAARDPSRAVRVKR